MKTALVTGITGQDGHYLSDFLIKKGYTVYGMYRRSSLDVSERIESLNPKVRLVEGDLIDVPSLSRIINDVEPDEIYNLGSQSFVPASLTQPVATAEITGLGVLNLMEVVKGFKKKRIKVYQASTSELFGKVQEVPQKETTPFYPRSIYAVSKLFGHWVVKNYRESFDMFCCSGILFNHESPIRPKQFVTRKITHSVAKIALGQQEYFEIGNMDAKRDWGYAGDYVEAMWMMLQQEKPDDYVISTEETHTVREFIEESFRTLNMEIKWEGEGIREVGKVDGKVRVKVNPKFYRPAEVDLLIGDCSKAKKELGWKPKTKFKELVKMMVRSDYENLYDIPK